MVFSSIEFIFLFLPLVLALYYVVPFWAKNAVLLIASLFFYSWGEPVYILLMLLATLFGYINGLLQHKLKDIKKRKTVLAITIILNLGILMIFKYSDFMIGIINSLAGKTIINTLDLTLPIGISFYTFQIVSYDIDVYRNPEIAESNYFSLLTYISMFPQLIAGPIVRYETIRSELHNRKICFDDYCTGIKRFLFGLFKKVIIANNIGILWTTISNTDISSMSMASAWLGVVTFSLQLYFDFSGYADMAIGMGRMLGFSFNENFNYPFIANSISDFWRRWHMSLSTWFRDYVYIPLGGNRCPVRRNIFNIFVVWTLTGLWHGADWNYIFWGMYYGILLILEKFVYGKYIQKLPRLVTHIYTLFFVTIGFEAFAFENLSQLIGYLKVMLFGWCNMTNASCIVDKRFLFYISNFGVLMLIAVVLCTPIYKKASAKVNDSNPKIRRTVKFLSYTLYSVLFIVTIAYLVSQSYNPFLYFKF